MKTVLVLLVLVGVALALPQPRAICNSYNDHNLKVGCDPASAANVLMSKTIVADGKLFQVQTRNAYYPDVGIGKKITCIQIVDKMPNNRGGCPFIIDGGLGYNYVQLQFISQVSQGLNFLVQIYGEA